MLAHPLDQPRGFVLAQVRADPGEQLGQLGADALGLAVKRLKLASADALMEAATGWVRKALKRS